MYKSDVHTNQTLTCATAACIHLNTPEYRTQRERMCKKTRDYFILLLQNMRAIHQRLGNGTDNTADTLDLPLLPTPCSVLSEHLRTWCGGVLEIFMPMTPLTGEVSAGSAERCTKRHS